MLLYPTWSIPLPFDDFFSFIPYPHTRGHSLRLAQSYTKSNSRKHCSYRIIPIWNGLPESIVTTPSLPSFKRAITKHNLSTHLTIPTFFPPPSLPPSPPHP